MPSFLSMQARWEVIQHLALRYHQAPRAQKTHLLNECVSVTGYTRKYALRPLNHPEEARLRHQRASLYGEDVLNALLAAWCYQSYLCQAADPFPAHPCGSTRTAWPCASQPGASYPTAHHERGHG